jgi:membrane fusion protein, multidrug efflux system
VNNIPLLSVLTSLAIAVGGCSDGVKRAAPAAPVLVARAVTTNVPVLIKPPPVGHVLAYSTVSVHSQIGGVLTEVHFQQGQAVRKGDRLFSIDPRPAQAALALAKANLARDRAQMKNAQIQFDREQKLLDQKLISEDEFDTNKANLDALTGTVQADEAAVTNAELNLDYCQIRAPIDGVTGALQFYPGNVVKAPDDTLVTINQIHPIYIQFGVPEQFLPEIRREMREHPLKVSASFANLKGPAPQGELTFIDNAVDTSTGMIQLKATFPNVDGALWPGQFVSVSLTLSELTNIVAVPSQAVETGQNGQFIYVVNADQTAEERPVTIGVTYDGDTVIEKGLKAGETVVTDGQLRLAPGMPVSVKNSAATGATNSPAHSR